MPEFDTLPEALDWFFENVYPHLPTEEKIKLKDVKYTFYKREVNVSANRIRRVLNTYGTYQNVHRFEWKKKEDE